MPVGAQLRGQQLALLRRHQLRLARELRVLPQVRLGAYLLLGEGVILIG